MTYFSMKDFDTPKKVRKGTIIFFKDKKAKHYSSSSSSVSSRE